MFYSIATCKIFQTSKVKQNIVFSAISFTHMNFSKVVRRELTVMVTAKAGRTQVRQLTSLSPSRAIMGLFGAANDDDEMSSSDEEDEDEDDYEDIYSEDGENNGNRERGASIIDGKSDDPEVGDADDSMPDLQFSDSGEENFGCKLHSFQSGNADQASEDNRDEQIFVQKQ